MNSITSDCYYTAEKNPAILESVGIVSTTSSLGGINVPVERQKKIILKVTSSRLVINSSSSKHGCSLKLVGLQQ